MNKIIKTLIFASLTIAAVSCARVAKVGANDDAKRYFDAWMAVNHPDLKPTGLGIYVLEEEKGSGIEVKSDGFAIVEYLITDLEGNITDYTYKETAKQLGEYDTTYYYGTDVISTIEGAIYAGVEETLLGMRAGGRKKVIIPGWLMTYAQYDSEEDYLATSSTSSSAIYDLRVVDYTDSIQLYEISQIEKYMSENSAIFNGNIVNDTTGFYYKSIEKPLSETFTDDTTFYINYTGKLLNGLVFDTTNEKIAKDNGLYTSGATYAPVKINWTKTTEDDVEKLSITMGDSDTQVVDGFARIIKQMHPMERGIGIFYSPLGYSYNGSGNSIPGYSPLVFEIEIVDKPEE